MINLDSIVFYSPFILLMLIQTALLCAGTPYKKQRTIVWTTNLCLLACLGIYLYLGRLTTMNKITFTINHPRLMHQLTHALNHPTQLLNQLKDYSQKHPKDKRARALYQKLKLTLSKEP
jgi:hypothetical protein